MKLYRSEEGVVYSLWASDAVMPARGGCWFWDLGRPISRHLHYDTSGQVAQFEERKERRINRCLKTGQSAMISRN
jgi:hypothetical protein